MTFYGIIRILVVYVVSYRHNVCLFVKELFSIETDETFSYVRNIRKLLELLTVLCCVVLCCDALCMNYESTSTLDHSLPNNQDNYMLLQKYSPRESQFEVRKYIVLIFLPVIYIKNSSVYSNVFHRCKSTRHWPRISNNQL